MVKASADWFATSLDALREALPRYRVAMIGSGELAGVTLFLAWLQAVHVQTPCCPGRRVWELSAAFNGALGVAPPFLLALRARCA